LLIYCFPFLEQHNNMAEPTPPPLLKRPRDEHEGIGAEDKPDGPDQPKRSVTVFVRLAFLRAESKKSYMPAMAKDDQRTLFKTVYRLDVTPGTKLLDVQKLMVQQLEQEFCTRGFVPSPFNAPSLFSPAALKAWINYGDGDVGTNPCGQQYVQLPYQSLVGHRDELIFLDADISTPHDFLNILDEDS
jgi:hypothetical protein